jgi:hypothetical protein
MTTQNETLAQDDTGTSETNQVKEKTYSQKEFDDAMARTKSAIARKFERQLEDLGDLEELKQIKAEAERRKIEDQKKRGEFDTIIAKLAASKDEEIRKRDEIIKNYTVDMPLVNTAAQLGSVNPRQVQSLLKPYVRLGESGDVEVLDDTGSVRYSERGQPFRVEDLVKEFLETNPHFKTAGPSTVNTKSNISSSRERFDVSKLDMNKPADRKLYAEWRKNNK